MLANTVGREPAAIKVSLQCRRGCSSGFCWRSPWQEPPVKMEGCSWRHLKHMEKATRGGTDARSDTGAKFYSFFPIMKIGLVATHQAVQRGFCCPGVLSSSSSQPKKQSGLLSVKQIQADLQGVRIKIVLIRKASPLQIRTEKSYLAIFCSYQEDRWKCKCTHICRFKH